MPTDVTDGAQAPRKAVILARGLGTRMRARDDSAVLGRAQATAADAGEKAMVPITGDRPFLDYVLSALADAGYTAMCLVVAPPPEHDGLRSRYGHRALTRMTVDFFVQATARGTADALLAAESWTDGEPFLALNADNYYPLSGLARLREAQGPATLAFSRAGLLRAGAIPRDRLARYALLEVDRQGYVTDVIEKPADHEMAGRPDAAISMNVWRLDRTIFRACREVQPSPRGELELPMAVRLAVRELGMRMRALPIDAPVLDLSSRGDIPAVAAKLRDVPVQL